MRQCAGILAILGMLVSLTLQGAETPCDARECVERALRETGVHLGFDADRNAIGKIGVYKMKCDPVRTEDFQMRRREAFEIAYLKALSAIARCVGGNMKVDDPMTLNRRDASRTMSSRISSALRLRGVSVLRQAESWSGQVYQCAVAVVWSRKLHDRHLAMAQGKKPSDLKPGHSSFDQWLDDQYLHGDLWNMVGLRRYVDENGCEWILGGVSSEDLSHNRAFELKFQVASLLELALGGKVSAAMESERRSCDGDRQGKRMQTEDNVKEMLSGHDYRYASEGPSHKFTRTISFKPDHGLSGFFPRLKWTEKKMDDPLSGKTVKVVLGYAPLADLLR